VTVLAGILLVLAVSAAVALPLARHPKPDAMQVRGLPEATEVLVHEKDIALMAIKEAEFDRAMGKLSEDDYSTLRSEYEERALTALSELDHLAVGSSPATPVGGRPTLGTTVADGGTRAAAFCPACGQAFLPEDRFCAGCGSARRNLAG